MNIKNNKNCKITINDKKISVSEKVKTANEMFEELGYEKPEDTIFNIEKFVKTIGKTKYCIAFDYFYRRISVFTFEDRESRKDISMQELQAINKKCEELGWI